MALSTPVSKAAAVTATSGTTVVTPSFTPTANALLIVAVSYGEALTGDSTRTISDTLGGLTWTETGVYASTKGGYAGIFTAKAPASPVAGTVTCTFSLTITRALIRPFEITGQNTTTPLGATGTNQFSGAGTSLAVTLSATPATDSTVFAVIGGKHAASTVTEDAAYTHLTTDTIGTGPTGLLDTSYDAASATNSLTWTGITTGTNNAVCGAAVEIKSASGAVSVSLTGVAPNVTVAGVVGTVTTVKIVTVTGVAPNVTVAGVAGTVTIATPVSVSLTGVAPNITVAGVVGTVTVRLVITVTGVAPNVTVAGVAGTVAATSSAVLTGAIAHITVAGRAGTVTVVTTQVFTPPTRYYVPSVTPFTPNLERTPAAYFKHTNIPKPSNVFKMLDGTYTEDQIGTDFWANVAIAYLGGHGPYIVTAAEAAALTAAGYGSNIA